jgi:hypothetical protein
LLLIQLPFHGRWGRQVKKRISFNYMENYKTCLYEQEKVVLPHPDNILQLHQSPSKREIKEA